MVRETYGVLRQAMTAGVADNVIPDAMARKLENSLFLFSGFKTAQELKDISLRLRNDDGTVKGFSKFLTEVRSIDRAYNVNYLRAEYNFAVSSSQMAASWAEVKAAGNRYDLQYRTAGDDHVREEHRPLAGVTLPVSDDFWRYYYPPNGWGCRCTAVQVVKGKYPTSDSKAAILAGDRTTDTPKKRIFRFNPGIDGQIFPPKHPYYKLSREAAGQVKKAVENIRKEPVSAPLKPEVDIKELIPKERITYNHIGTIMGEYAKRFPEDFNGGLIEFELKYSDSAFMSNGRYVGIPGNILTIYSHKFSVTRQGQKCIFNPAAETRDAFVAIREGRTLTFSQEYAIESLWHETLHAKAKGWGNRFLRSSITTMQMETVNQFIARHTYPQFMARFGSQATHQAAILDEGYGYHRYLINFRNMLKHYGIDEAETVEALKTALLNEPYEMVGKCAVSFLTQKGVKNAKILMEQLEMSKHDFLKLL